MFTAQKISLAVISISVLLTVETFSCSSVQGASATEPASNKNPPQTAHAVRSAKEPPKVQESFQEEFARQMAKAGPKSEGWALFSDSPMSHNGQRWIIKSPAGKTEEIKLCVIEQGQKTCSESKLTRAQFAKLRPALKSGDTLEHILPTVFDGVSYEFVHAFSGNPQTKRVVFITSMKPFPAEYLNVIKAFNQPAK